MTAIYYKCILKSKKNPKKITFYHVKENMLEKYFGHEKKGVDLNGLQWKIIKEVDKKLSIILIDLMQKWLPLNYSSVLIQNSLTKLVRKTKFFTIFVTETKLARLFEIRTKE